MSRVTKEMDDAEDALIATGFSAEQWMLIKQYLFAAIVQNQIAVARALSSLPTSGEGPHS